MIYLHTKTRYQHYGVWLRKPHGYYSSVVLLAFRLFWVFDE